MEPVAGPRRGSRRLFGRPSVLASAAVPPGAGSSAAPIGLPRASGARKLWAQRDLNHAETSGSRVAKCRENVVNQTTQCDAKRRGLSASRSRIDDAIPTATTVAIDAGDYAKARSLLDILDAKRRIAAAP